MLRASIVKPKKDDEEEETPGIMLGFNHEDVDHLKSERGYMTFNLSELGLPPMDVLILCEETDEDIVQVLEANFRNVVKKEDTH